MRPPRSLNDSFTILGFRIPLAVGAIAGAIILASALGATAERNGVRVISTLMLVPRDVWLGQLWRVATWSCFELSALSLLFAVLMLTFFGRDLCYAWGGGRFLVFWVSTTIATGASLCLSGWALGRPVLDFPYATAWPIVEAVTVAWALTFPTRTIL